MKYSLKIYFHFSLQFLPFSLTAGKSLILCLRAHTPGSILPGATAHCTPADIIVAMETLNICLVGFGSVNRALVRLVAREALWLRQHHSLDVQFSAIVARHGAWEPRSGDYLPPVAVLARLADMVAAGEARLDAGSLAATASALGFDAATVLATSSPPTAAILELITRRLAPPADGLESIACLAEAVDVDYVAGEPATSYLRAALSAGAHAVSANKGPVVHARAALLALARDKGVRYLHESAVMDGVPIFSSWAGGFRPGGVRARTASIPPVYPLKPSAQRKPEARSPRPEAASL